MMLMVLAPRSLWSINEGSSHPRVSSQSTPNDAEARVSAHIVGWMFVAVGPVRAAMPCISLNEILQSLQATNFHHCAVYEFRSAEGTDSTFLSTSVAAPKIWHTGP